METEIPRIAVLMSTYNGEKYIKEQIDSILTQKGVNADIYVRDDCSTDSTREILKSYAKDGKIIYMPGQKNLGPGRSFMTMLYKVAKEKEYEYFAFADQDDIWLEEKLLRAVGKIKEVEREIGGVICNPVPILYCSNQIIYQDGEIKGYRFKEAADLSIASIVCRNHLYGCTYLFNLCLAEIIAGKPMPPEVILKYSNHDAWVLYGAILMGTVIYDKEAYILYRIHENNTVGIKEASWRDYLHRFYSQTFLHSDRANLRNKRAKILLEYYPDMRESDREPLERLANYQAGIRQKLAILRDKEIIKATGENPFVFRMKVLVNFV